MAELAVVRRYARALFDTANHSGTVEQVEGDLKTIDQVFRAVPHLTRVLRAPTISAGRKKELFSQTFGDRVGPLTLRFLTLLVDRRREDVLTDMYGEYQRLANEFRNILPVDVTAAVALTDMERDALAEALARRTGKRIFMRLAIDPSLMGGLIVRMGDTIIDGSVRSRLGQLRSLLLTGRGA
jgi:F-type H+-transporting ATPase subunit delta